MQGGDDLKARLEGTAAEPSVVVRALAHAVIAPSPSARIVAPFGVRTGVMLAEWLLNPIVD